MENKEAAIEWFSMLKKKFVKTEYEGYLDLAISALEKQEENRWIPVTERLPEYGTLVLTQLLNNDIVTNWVIDEEDEEWFEDDVIAWKPLPELFQEEE